MGRPGAFQVWPSDLISIQDWVLPYSPDLKNDDGAIHFLASDTLFLLDGKIAGLAIADSSLIHYRIDTGNTKVLEGLKMLVITEDGLNAHKAVVEKISKISPHCNLLLHQSLQSNQVRWLLDHFDPVMVQWSLNPGNEQMLKTEPQLQSLMIAYEDTFFINEPLPNLPSLQTLIVMVNNDEDSIPHQNVNWLSNNPQIKNLILSPWDSLTFGMDILNELEAPESLIGCEPGADTASIMAHKKSLKRVFADNNQIQMELPDINWVTLAGEPLTQQDINSLVTAKPDCQTLEIFAESAPIDLSPLLSLKSLKFLTIVDGDSINPEPLKEMTQLRLLSISTGENNTDSVVMILQQALPETTVVPNEGFCLGSGWLLLFFPMMGISIALALRKRMRLT